MLWIIKRKFTLIFIETSKIDLLFCLTFAGVLNSLCCSSENSMAANNEVLSKLDLTDPRSAPIIHSSLSVFTAILIARHCFTLTNFLNHVVFSSLKAAWNNGKLGRSRWVIVKRVELFTSLLLANYRSQFVLLSRREFVCLLKLLTT